MSQLRGEKSHLLIYIYFFFHRTNHAQNKLCKLSEEKSFSPQFKLIPQKCGWINTLAEVCTLITNFRPLKLPALESASEFTQHALSQPSYLLRSYKSFRDISRITLKIRVRNTFTLTSFGGRKLIFQTMAFPRILFAVLGISRGKKSFLSLLSLSLCCC